MIRLFSEDLGVPALFCAAAVDGLFTDVVEPLPGQITFSGVTEASADLRAFHRRLDFLYVELLSSTGRPWARFTSALRR